MKITVNPSSFVRTKEDEKLWTLAKKAAKKQYFKKPYNKFTEKDWDRYYSIVTGIVRNIKEFRSNPKKMTTQEAYETLTEANVHWTRKDPTHIVVWTSGYVTQDAHNIEKFLMKAGMRLVDQNFDKISGKTASVFKHKSNPKYDRESLKRGAQHELEHTADLKEASKIAADHLAEDPEYYEKLETAMNPLPDLEFEEIP